MIDDRTVTATTRCRVDLAGGTLDIWPLGLLFPGARTVNVAIDLPVSVTLRASTDGFFRVRQGEELVEARAVSELVAIPGASLIGVILRHLELEAVEVGVESASPRGGGLGASSAVAVGLIAAADQAGGREPRSVGETARLARDLEAVLMELPTGIQDHYPALLGGALDISYLPGGERVESLEVDLDELGEALHIVYSGQSHFSAATNWAIVKGCLDGTKGVRARFAGIVAAAARAATALRRGDLAALGRAMGEEWAHRCELAPGVTTEPLERLLEAARGAGAWGGKACGAGGGGCLAVLAPPARRPAVAAALAAAGGRCLPARPTAAALSITDEATA